MLLGVQARLVAPEAGYGGGQRSDADQDGDPAADDGPLQAEERRSGAGLEVAETWAASDDDDEDALQPAAHGVRGRGLQDDAPEDGADRVGRPGDRQYEQRRDQRVDQAEADDGERPRRRRRPGPRAPGG